MPTAGWYPDPAGTPGRYRYWDGQAWSEATTTDPSASAVPPGPAAGPKRRWGPIVLIAAVLAAVVVILALIFGPGNGSSFQEAPVDTDSASPTTSQWDETSTPTPTPSADQSLARCPVTQVRDTTRQTSANTLRGGGLEVPRIPGWQSDSSFYLDWVSDLHTAVDDVYPGWISNESVGALNAVDGFTDIRQSAHQTMECFASSGYYIGYTGRKDLVDEQISVDGHQAWHMRSEVYVSMPSLPQVKGDTVDVIVVDTGNKDRLGLFISSVNIGDSSRMDKMSAAIAGLKVIG
ncbi:Protein of unknown function [Propionibacterium cyclohexanicum]|uniref:DUF2510 domain-containing protein n=1 Tax=Propionibacterium cyclohexanicum TaxID=64702 RepID=A0A1H9PH35_9ACTN|nr:DUF2510 domain-containing protein [Propionibacterium cyclohexanicum]SER47464.1 Protein of unknown function [Propionibacterium cyclohexanicum]